MLYHGNAINSEMSQVLVPFGERTWALFRRSFVSKNDKSVVDIAVRKGASLFDARWELVFVFRTRPALPVIASSVQIQQWPKDVEFELDNSVLIATLQKQVNPMPFGMELCASVKASEFRHHE